MAASLSFLLLLLSSLFLSPINSLLLPVTRHPSTLQYLTTLSYGTPLVPTTLVLDLGGSSLWFHCSSRNPPSSSSQFIPPRSIPCLKAKSHQFDSQIPSDSQACQVFPENSITGIRDGAGELVQDLVTLRSGNMQIFHERLLFTCSPSLLLYGLASGAKGMAGLGRTQSSLSSQILNSYSSHRKFSLCLSSSSGVAFFGNMAVESEIFRSLTFTPFITPENQKQSSPEFLINVNSIKINGKRLTLHDGGQGIQTQLSSIVPYTTMESSIYSTFEEAFLQAAVCMNMTRVAPVGHFRLCFSSRGVDGSQVGPSVPVIELVLQSEMVKWRIHGRNSMVRASDEVMCLGFLDGGLNSNPRNGIVIGGYQLEDVIVQFDLETSMMGFSPSLVMKNTTCSDLKSGYMPSESV